MNAPKLRFKEFTNEWNYRCLSEISTEITYGMNSASTEFDGLNKYIRITDIDDETGNFKPNNLVSPSSKLEDKFLVKKDDILFARTGASTGKTYLYNIKDGKLYFAGFLIKAHIANHNSNFIFQQTKLEKYKKWVKLTSMRSGQPGINSEEYGKCIFSITSLSEENKIAQFLSLLDKKIELQTKKIEALKLFKKGLLNEFLRCNPCNKISLKDILKERKEYSTKAGNLPHVTLSKNGIEEKTERYNRDFLVKSKDKNYKITKIYDLCYNPANLKFGVICLNTYGSAIFSPIYVTFEINYKFNPLYIGYYVTQQSFINSARKYEQGTVYERMAVAPEDFLKLNIWVPNKHIQDKFSTILISMDTKLKKEKEKLKKGFMQSMFV